MVIIGSWLSSDCGVSLVGSPFADVLGFILASSCLRRPDVFFLLLSLMLFERLKNTDKPIPIQLCQHRSLLTRSLGFTLCARGIFSSKRKKGRSAATWPPGSLNKPQHIILVSSHVSLIPHGGSCATPLHWEKEWHGFDCYRESSMIACIPLFPFRRIIKAER